MVDLNKHIYGNGCGPGALDKWLSVTEGLTLVAPFVKTPEVYSVAGGNMEALTTETVDADATKRSWGGYVAHATANTARWQPGRGVICEGARTNVALQSEDLTTSWTNINSTDSPNVAVAPDGRMTADKLIEDATAGVSHVIHNDDGHGFDGASAYTSSYFVKAAERTWCIIRLPVQKFVGAPNCFFDVGNGVVGTATDCTAKMTAYPLGWWRCEITATSDVAGAQPAGSRINLSTGDTVNTYDGDGTSGLYVWGHQLEVGYHASSYIPTAAASVARAADALEIDNTAAIHLPAAQGTICLTCRVPATPAAEQWLLWSSVAAGANRLDLRLKTDRKLRLLYGLAAAWADITTTTALTAGTVHVITVTYSGTTATLYIDGASEGSDDAAAQRDAAKTSIEIGALSGAANFYGDIGCILAYDRALSGLEIQSLTKDVQREMGIVT